jgi:DnaJ-class molecular chaperone
MEYRDYYAILGVDKKAADKEIKSAYRRLARKFHPDVNPNDREATEKFKEINEAYQVLSDPAKRSRYDQLGPDWEKTFRAGGFGQGAGPGRPGGPGGFGPGFPGGFRNVRVEWANAGESGDFSDFFRTVFGDIGGVSDLGGLGDLLGGGARAAGRKARRPRATWRGPGPAGEQPGFAANDVEHPLEISLEEAFFGGQRALQIETGEGGTPRRLEVKIPAGIREGQRLRVAGQGVGGGDLYLTIRYQPHPIFQAKGDNLETEAAVDLYQALLGADVEVLTMRGKASMKIPPETQPGQVFRLRGQGLPASGAHPVGDELVRVRVVLPTGLEDKAKDLVKEMAQVHPYTPR